MTSVFFIAIKTLDYYEKAFQTSYKQNICNEKCTNLIYSGFVPKEQYCTALLLIMHCIYNVLGVIPLHFFSSGDSPVCSKRRHFQEPSRTCPNTGQIRNVGPQMWSVSGPMKVIQ